MESIADRSIPENVLAFNFRPASYMDASWWDEAWMPRENFDVLCEAVEVSYFIVREYSLGAVLDVDYSSPLARLALLGRADFQHLVFAAGVVQMSHYIASLLRSSDISKTKEITGLGLYNLALRSGRFLLKQSKLPISPNHEGETDDLLPLCQEKGIRAMASALAPLPDDINRRCQLKLPKRLVKGFWFPDDDSVNERWLQMVLMLERQLTAKAADLPETVFV